MQQGFEAVNEVDEAGLPAGGSVDGVGISIFWQNGPLGRVGTEERVPPNGAFVEDVIAAVIQRIQHYQEVDGGEFSCRENALAITKLEEALHWLEARTARRVAAGVEGTHEGS